MTSQSSSEMKLLMDKMGGSRLSTLRFSKSILTGRNCVFNEFPNPSRPALGCDATGRPPAANTSGLMRTMVLGPDTGGGTFGLSVPAGVSSVGGATAARTLNFAQRFTRFVELSCSVAVAFLSCALSPSPTLAHLELGTRAASPAPIAPTAAQDILETTLLNPACVVSGLCGLCGVLYPWARHLDTRRSVKRAHVAGAKLEAKFELGLTCDNWPWSCSQKCVWRERFRHSDGKQETPHVRDWRGLSFASCYSNGPNGDG
eukprot:466900-Prorocentrum_minimum.AAC.7